MEKKNLKYAVEIVCRNGFVKKYVESETPITFKNIDLLKDSSVHSLNFREVYDSTDKNYQTVHKNSVVKKFYIGKACKFEDVPEESVARFYNNFEVKLLKARNEDCVLFRDDEYEFVSKQSMLGRKFYAVSIISPEMLENISEINCEEIAFNKNLLNP